VRLLKGYGLDPGNGEAPINQRQWHADLDHLVEGFNLQLNPMEAAVVNAKLTQADTWSARRQAIANRYTELLADMPGIVAPEVPPGLQHAWRNYVVRVLDRVRVRTRLRERGIATGVLYTPPIHLQTIYRGLGLGPGSFPVAEALARDLLCLPMHPGLTDEQVDTISAVIGAALVGGPCQTTFAATSPARPE
jgi:dTDP-4-amino-4,6-dideoxygalactose transaminase